MVAYPTTVWIIEHFSWEAVFYFNAALGIAWVALWLAYATDTPREHRAVGQEELHVIEQGLVPKASAVAVPLLSLLRSPSVLSLCLSYMFFGFIAWIFILWFPTYLVEARGLSRMHMGLVGMLPTAASFLGIVTGGVLSDALIRRGVSVRTARARFPGLMVGLSLPFLLAAVTVPSATVAVALFVGFYFTLSLAVAGYWSMPLELNPRLVGRIAGIMNAAGNLAGIFGPLTAGVIVARTGNWELPFYLVAVLGVCCSALFVFLVTAKPVVIPQPAAPLALQKATESQ
jgi:nitrate/nitrite transporter NarK